MKKHLLIALFAAFTATAFAERPSIDETTVRLGVNEWLAVRSAEKGQFNFLKLRDLYRPDVEFTDPTTGKASETRGLSAYTARLLPLTENVRSYIAVPQGDVRVTMNGQTATTSFAFQSQGSYKDGSPVTCGGQVKLTWVRHEGFWQVAREEIAPLDGKTPGEVAIAK